MNISSLPAEAEPRTVTMIEQIKIEAKAFFLGTKLNILMVCFPFAIAARYAHWGDGATFVLSCLALTPLAERLGFVTEQLAMYTNDTIGGLLNATFGNATEVIISAFALSKGGTQYLRVVQLSLLGSVTSNLLLVMGSAFVAGGVKRKSQSFGREGVSVNCAMLLLASAAIVFPSLLSETHTEGKGRTNELALSRFESIIMVLLYGAYLVFQLVTHKHLFEEGEEEGNASESSETQKLLGSAESDSAEPPGGQEKGLLTGAAVVDASTSPTAAAVELGEAKDVEFGKSKEAEAVDAPKHDADEEKEEKVLSKTGCFLWLAGVAVFISWLSELVTDAIKGASTSLNIPLPFLTAVLLPIVGNAAEHASAIVFAYRNRIEISLGVAVGSSTQVATLVIPLCVLLGWCLGQPLDLNFNGFESGVLVLTVLLASLVLQDGTANWMKGALLLVAYFFLAAGFWCHKDPQLSLPVDGAVEAAAAAAGRRS